MNTRRELLRNGVRLGGLTALAALASVLGIRRLRQGNCPKANPCGECPLYSACELPKERGETAQGGRG